MFWKVLSGIALVMIGLHLGQGEWGYALLWLGSFAAAQANVWLRDDEEEDDL